MGLLSSASPRFPHDAPEDPCDTLLPDNGQHGIKHGGISELGGTTQQSSFLTRSSYEVELDPKHGGGAPRRPLQTGGGGGGGEGRP